jgi:hypothetical protein
VTTSVTLTDNVVVVVRNFKSPKTLEQLLAADGYGIVHVYSLDEAVAFLAARSARAVVVGIEPLNHKDRLAARRCRRMAPQTALVALAGDSTPLWQLKHALDWNATALLLWPSERSLVVSALASGSGRTR